jgi:hypothetical protein
VTGLVRDVAPRAPGASRAASGDGGAGLRPAVAAAGQERARPYGAPGEPPLRRPWHRPAGSTGDLREKGWVPLPRLALWWFLLLLGDLVFYVLLTPIWLGLRAAAWVAELRSRASRS